MKRKFNMGLTPPILSLAVASLVASNPAAGQDSINVITFLQAVRQTCGGTSGATFTSPNADIAFKNAEISIDRGTGELKVERNGVLIASADGIANEAYYKCVENLAKVLGESLSSSGGSSQIEVFGGEISTTWFSPHENSKIPYGNAGFSDFIHGNRDSVVYLDVSQQCCGIYPINYFIETICNPGVYGIGSQLDDPEKYTVISVPVKGFDDLKVEYPEVFHGFAGSFDSLAAFEKLFTRDSFLANDLEYSLREERCSLPIVVEVGSYYATAGCGTSCTIETYKGFYLIQERLTRHSRYYLLTEQDASPSEWSAASRRLREIAQ